MNAWSRRREDRRRRKAQKAQDRLHGRGAVGRSRSSSRGEGVGEFIVDVLLALPRGILWVLSKIID